MVKTPQKQKNELTPGLSSKLIAMIIIVILAVEVLIFLPSLANSRANWLDDRIRVGAVAVKVLDAVPQDMELPRDLADRLLETAGANAIVFRRDGQSLLLERSEMEMPDRVVTADTRQRNPLALIWGGIDTLVFGGDRMLRIVGATYETGGNPIEILMSEAPLRQSLLIYSRNVFFLSLIVAMMTAGAIFLFVNSLLVRPIQRITSNMVSFRQAPENASLIIEPSDRRDEIGVMVRELAAMESDIFSMLRQRRHLADLGLAVAKINHDLRNTLSSAQLLSDQVATLEDPQVQRLAPRLVHTLDKAIGFAQSVLDYGRQSAAPPKPELVDLHALIDEAAFDAGLVGNPKITLKNSVPDAVSILVDPDQMARVLLNLLKNARQALEGAAPNGSGQGMICLDYAEDEEFITVSVADNGPGLPKRALDNLFVAFEGSARSGGTGLGLAIARELIEAHGGTLRHVPQEKGALFEIRLPRTKRVA